MAPVLEGQVSFFTVPGRSSPIPSRTRAYNPVWVKAIKTPADFAITLTGFGMLMFWKAPPWIVVIICVLARSLLGVVMS